jgi:hypothetical protein
LSSRRELVVLALFGVVVAALAAMGIGARATHGAQTTADEPQYLLSAISLWEDGDLDISDELAQERYREFHEAELPEQTMPLEDGSRVSPHDPLLPVLLALPVGLGGWVGAKVAMAAMGGALAALLVWTAQNRFDISRRTAFVVVALCALAPPLAIYSTQVYPEIPAALALLTGLTAILGPSSRTGRVVFVIAVVALPWLAIKYVPVAAVLAVAGLVRAGKGHRVRLGGLLAAAAVLYVVGHVAIYGGLTAYSTGDHFVGGEFTAVGSEVDLWGRSTRLIGLIVDHGFGIGAWQPLFVLLPLVAAWAIARRRDGYAVSVAILGTGWLVATFVALTMQGWWFPGRQVIVVMPIAVLLTAAWVDDRSRSRTPLMLGLGLAGAIAYAFLAVEGAVGRLTWVVDFGMTANPAYQALSALLPDYLTPTTSTWVLHGLWVTVALAMAWVGAWAGWRDGSLPTGRHISEIERQRIPEGIST